MKMSTKNIVIAVVSVLLLGTGYFYLRKWMSPAEAPAAE